MSNVATELAGAVRAVNAAWRRIPERYRPPAAPWADLEREVGAARAVGDTRRALAAIEAWRELRLMRFTAVLANCPLGGEERRAERA